MKASQNQKHLGQSITFGVVLMIVSVGIVVLMLAQSATLP